MSEFICPKGHVSSEADYCSECGAKMVGGEQAGAGSGTPQAGETCPECGTPRENHNVVFCDVCGFNFVTGVSGGLGITVPAPVAVPVIPAAAPPVPAAHWSVTLTVDETLHEPGSPDAPVGVGPFDFALSSPVNLIGRKSEARGILPEIPISYDDAVSHRHALLQVDGSGGLLLRDIGAANGTRLNGVEVTPLTDVALKAGDAITLGHWSRLTVSEA